MNEKLQKLIDANRKGYGINLPYVTTHEMIRDFIEELDRLNAESDELERTIQGVNWAFDAVCMELTETKKKLETISIRLGEK